MSPDGPSPAMHVGTVFVGRIREQRLPLPTLGGQPYLNYNPSQTVDERRVGQTLDQLAQLNQLRGIQRVIGRAQASGRRVRNPDYGLLRAGREHLTADLYQPRTTNPESIAASLIKKSGQADVGVLELISAVNAPTVVESVLHTPGHTIRWIIVLQEHCAWLFTTDFLA